MSFDGRLLAGVSPPWQRWPQARSSWPQLIRQLWERSFRIRNRYHSLENTLKIQVLWGYR
jgi:hypothetical protein